MSEDYCALLLEDFLKGFFSSVKILVERLSRLQRGKTSKNNYAFSLC